MATTTGQSHSNTKSTASRPTVRAIDAKRKRAFRIGAGIGAAVAITVALLIFQNGQSAQIHWLWFHFNAPLWLMLASTLVAGAVTWELIKAAVHRSRQHLANRRTSQKSAT
jgi:uncharacterized integral membrane protein